MRRRFRLGALTPAFVEKETGDQLAPQLEQMYGGVYDNPPMTAYVTGVAQSMYPWTLRASEPHTYKILQSTSIVNAFTLGNGNIYVTIGLLNMIGDEAELAEVLGHEDGHFGLHHIGATIDDQIGTSLLMTLAEGVFAAINKGQVTDQQQGVIDKANALIPGLILNGFSRERELEADQQGLNSMVPAGYDPGGSITLFQRLQAQETKVTGIQAYMQSHPTAATRIQDLEATIDSAYPGKIGTGARNASRYQDNVLGPLEGVGSPGNNILVPAIAALGVAALAGSIVWLISRKSHGSR